MEAAALYLGAALEMDPDNLELLKRTFLVYLSDAKYEQAFDLAEKIHELSPEDIFSALALVTRDLQANHFEKARQRLEEQPQGGIFSYLAPLLISWTHAGENNADAAVSALEPLNHTHGAAMLHRAHSALIQAKLGNMQEAEKQFVLLMEEQGGLSLRTSELLGYLYEITGQFEKAEALYKSFKSDNANTKLMDTLLQRVAKRKIPEGEYITAAEGAAEAMLDLTGSLRQQNAQESALLLARLGLYLRPSFPTLQLIIAATLEDIGRYQDANKVYESIDPSNSSYVWSARLRIASNLDVMGRTEEAIEALRSMAEENPAESSPLIDLGDVLRGSDRFQEAVEAYDEAFKRIKDLDDEHHWTLYYARGIALERAKDWDRAEDDLLKALELQPDQPYVLNYLGYTWIEKRMHLKRAQEMVQKAVNLRPNDGYIVDSLGWVYYQLGEFEKAVSELERAIELRPEDPIINDHLGDAYWRVGRFREARFQWRRSLNLDPDPDLIDTISDKLENGMPEWIADNGNNGNDS